MTIIIGPLTNVPAPGDPIRSNWAQSISHYVVDTPGLVKKNGDTMSGALTFSDVLRQDLILFTGYGLGVQSNVEYFRSGQHFAWYKGGSHNDAAFNAGGGVELMRLSGSTGLEVGQGLNYGRPLAIYGTNDGTSSYMGLYDGAATPTRKGYVGFAGTPAYMVVRDEVASGSLFLDAQGNIVFQTGPSYTERARWDNAGNLLVAKTVANLAAVGVELNPVGRLYVTTDTSVTGNNIVANINNAAVADVFASWRRNNTQIGSVSCASATAVAYNTTSDPRLKENLGPIPDAAERVHGLGAKVFAGRWIDPDTGQAEEGGDVWAFLSSHDVQDVAPYAVTGERDAVTPEPPLIDDGEGNMVPDPSAPPGGQILPQQVDYTAIVPLLTGALSQAIDRINDLEARLSTLEAA